MIVVTLQGGLGNQMFQYATARCLGNKLSRKVYFDTSFLELNNQSNDNFTARSYELDIFKNISQNFVEKKGTKRFRKRKDWKFINPFLFKNYRTYEEPHFNFDSSFFSLEPPVAIKGYFNSEDYFREIKDIIIKDFQFPQLKSTDSSNIALNAIINNPSVAVHIRRGDYLKPKVNSFHGVCSLDYYNRAIDFFLQKNPNSTFFCFTDDPVWVKENLLRDNKSYFLIQENIGKDSWKDMYLMTQCKNHIIANSTFSWWGAWLSVNTNNYVIAPQSWFNEKTIDTKDLIPNSWMRM